MDTKMDICEIAEELIKLYPDSCLATNDIVMVGCRDADYRKSLFEPVIDLFHYQILGFCGCGVPEYAMSIVKSVLTILDNHTHDLNSKSYYNNWATLLNLHVNDGSASDYSAIDEGVQLFILYTLDNCGLIEHGSSIYWAWLTPLGKMLLSVMRQYDEENEQHERSMDKTEN